MGDYVAMIYGSLSKYLHILIYGSSSDLRITTRSMDLVDINYSINLVAAFDFSYSPHSL